LSQYNSINLVGLKIILATVKKSMKKKLKEKKMKWKGKKRNEKKGLIKKKIVDINCEIL